MIARSIRRCVFVKRPDHRVLLLALILVSFSGPVDPHRQAFGQTETKNSRELRRVRDLDEFRSAFNRDAGVPRLILLLSPT